MSSLSSKKPLRTTSPNNTKAPPMNRRGFGRNASASPYLLLSGYGGGGASLTGFFANSSFTISIALLS